MSTDNTEEITIEIIPVIPEAFYRLSSRAVVAAPIPAALCGVEGCCFTPHDGGHTWEEPE